MRTVWIRASWVLVVFVLLSTAAVSQTSGDPSQLANLGRCDGCVSKVLQLPNSAKPTEMQDVVNLFRTVVELRFLTQDPQRHTISVTGTPEQLDVVDRLMTALDGFRSSGKQRSSVFVYEPRNPPPVEQTTQSPRKWIRPLDLEFSYIKAYYLPNSSAEQIWAKSNAVRTKLQVQRMQMLPSAHAVVIRGTSEQMEQADRLMNE